jgi:hypothetical protein
MDFQSEGGASNDVTQAVSTIVAQELERLELFHVSSAQTTRVMLGVERQRQLLGCDGCSGSSLTDLPQFEFVVSGKVVKTSRDVTLLMSLIPVGGARATSSTRVTAANDSQLLLEAGPAAVKLVGKMLEGRQGGALVTSSELGAAVKVDDVQVGTTPLSAPVKLAGGPHLIQVEKDGFTRSRRAVRVVPDQVIEEHFTLVPSPDTIKDYEARTGRTRLLAWTAAGVAVIGVGLFALGQFKSDDAYGGTTINNTFLYYQALLAAGTETGADKNGPINYRQRATDKANEVATWQAISIGALAVAGVAAIGSVVLFIIGEPPEKYEAFHAQLAVSPGGLVFAGGF